MRPISMERVEKTRENILGIITRSLDIAVHTFQKVDCDIQLRPIADVVDTLDVSAGEACFQLGEACAREHIEEILRLIHE